MQKLVIDKTQRQTKVNTKLKHMCMPFEHFLYYLFPVRLGKKVDVGDSFRIPTRGYKMG